MVNHIKTDIFVSLHPQRQDVNILLHLAFHKLSINRKNPPQKEEDFMHFHTKS